MSSHFSDGNMFMTLPDGRVAYSTNQKTWLDVFMHKLPLDDYFYYQSHKPNISFNFKNISRPMRKKKEGLNDEDRCDQCKEPFDTITFQTKNTRKEAVCSSCAYPSRMEQLERSAYLRDINNHLEKVETLLYRLYYIPGDYRVSVRWILPLLTDIMYKWTIGTGLYEINTLRMISRSWRVDEVNLIEVVKILREIRDKLLENM
jgi:hypothetical protein